MPGPVVFQGSGITAPPWLAGRRQLILYLSIPDTRESTEPDCSHAAHAAHAGRNALSNEAMVRETALE